MIADEKAITIMKYMKHYGFDDHYMASKLGLHFNTWRYKIKDVRKFKTDELLRINVILNIPRGEYV